nr:uncharacterized protein LOC102551086 [Rattus norvegicus]
MLLNLHLGSRFALKLDYWKQIQCFRNVTKSYILLVSSIQLLMGTDGLPDPLTWFDVLRVAKGGGSQEKPPEMTPGPTSVLGDVCHACGKLKSPVTTARRAVCPGDRQKDALAETRSKGKSSIWELASTVHASIGSWGRQEDAGSMRRAQGVAHTPSSLLYSTPASDTQKKNVFHMWIGEISKFEMYGDNLSWLIECAFSWQWSLTLFS